MQRRAAALTAFSGALFWEHLNVRGENDDNPLPRKEKAHFTYFCQRTFNTHQPTAHMTMICQMLSPRSREVCSWISIYWRLISPTQKVRGQITAGVVRQTKQCLQRLRFVVSRQEKQHQKNHFLLLLPYLSDQTTEEMELMKVAVQGKHKENCLKQHNKRFNAQNNPNM